MHQEEPLRTLSGTELFNFMQTIMDGPLFPPCMCTGIRTKISQVDWLLQPQRSAARNCRQIWMSISVQTVQFRSLLHNVLPFP